MKIKILPEEVASQIAAGEVIERPASVVKELLENAIDAGAEKITVRVEEAGKKLIEVSDDGSGIPVEELSLAVVGHATSKLSTAEDLFHIKTLGFRGEALASIGAVSRLTILSRSESAPNGARIVVEGGKVVGTDLTGGPSGTVVRVQDLFFNTPARLKFLKRDLTERQQIDALVTRYALAYPEKSIHLEEDEKSILMTSGNGNHREILAQIHGVDLAKQLLEVVLHEEGKRIHGFISPISVNRSNRKDITFFVNGRWVQDIALSTALLQAYHTLLMVGRYPMATLFLEVPPQEVDVNVHPAKTEVRFRDPEKVFSFVQRSTRRALLAFTPVPHFSPTRLWGITQPAGKFTRELEPAPHPEPSRESDLSVGREVEEQPGIPVQIPLMWVIGQVGTSYLVAEGPDGLYLIDQHAAHERILFEKLMNQYAQKSIPSQALLEPVVVDLSSATFEQLAKQIPGLQSLGFDVQPFGQNSIRVYAIPSLFNTPDPTAAILSLVETFEEDETPLQEELEAKIAGRVCKRLAIKAGQVLTPEEQRALLLELEACQSPRTCPHGRPTLIHLSIDMLERGFGRRGAR